MAGLVDVDGGHCIHYRRAHSRRHEFSGSAPLRVLVLVRPDQSDLRDSRGTDRLSWPRQRDRLDLLRFWPRREHSINVWPVRHSSATPTKFGPGVRRRCRRTVSDTAFSYWKAAVASL